MGKMKEISIELTHDCPMKCRYCSSSADHPSLSGELTLDEVKNILGEAAELNASILSISGGEPLIYHKIKEVLEFANKLNFNILLYTSGAIFTEKDKQISISVDYWNTIRSITKNQIKIIFGLQSSRSDIVDYLMDFNGAFNIIIQSIENAIESGLICEVHVSPMKSNYQDLPFLADFAEKLGVKKLSLLRFVPQGRGAKNVDALLLNPSEFIELQRIMLNLKREFKEGKRKIKFRFGHPIDFLFLFDEDYEITPCRGGTDAPLVLPNGDVHMCPAWKDMKHLKAGNIREQSFTEIWKSSKFFKEFRELIENPNKIQGKCNNCIFLAKCKGGCTAQRILINGIDKKYPECMYQSPDPLCPILFKQNLRGKKRIS